MSKKYLHYAIIILLGCLALLPFLVLAIDHGEGAAATQAYGTTQAADAAKLATFIGNIAGAALTIAGALFLFLVVYGGILIMSAAGNQSQVDKGKKIITWAIIGALVIGSAYFITATIFGIF
jgi:hypothetical protein